MTTSTTELFVGFMIWKALASISEQFPGHPVKIRETSSKSIHEAQILPKNNSGKECRICMVAKHAGTPNQRWSFHISPHENYQIEDSEKRGFEPFVLLATSMQGVVCVDRNLYYAVRQGRRTFNFSVQKRSSERSYRVSVPGKSKPETVFQNRFPRQLLEHIGNEFKAG